MRIAQRFIAGFKMVPQETSPVGADEEQDGVQSSLRDFDSVWAIPAINRWAMVVSSLRDDGTRDIRDHLQRSTQWDFAL